MENMKSSSILHSIIIIIFLIVEQSIVCCLAKNNITFDCVPREKNALLRFKASLSDPFDRLSSWKTEYYCCSWEGVECDKATGHVIELHLGNRVKEEHDYTFTTPLITLRSERVDSSLMELKYLHYLDLSLCDFQGSSIPTSLGSMKHLQHLNLSNANFSGVVPHQLSNLSSLRTLDLNPIDGLLIVDDLTWANNLSFLEYLDMSNVYLGSIKDVVKVLGTLPSLLELRMSNSGLDNTNLPHTNCFYSTLFAIVQHLDLSFNNFEGEFPCFLRNMTSLSFLDLSYNSFNSSAHQPFPRLMNLSYLDLSSNSFNHSATWISDFLLNKYCRLKSLNLWGNHFHGDISGVFKNISKCSSHNLESLDLGSNEFHGNFPEELGELRQLKVFRVSYNQLSGEIPIVLGQLSNLEKIYVSHNTLEGTLSDAHFVRLSKLVAFYASYNYMLKFRVRYNWVPPCQLKYLFLGSVQIGGQIPDWLQTQKSLTRLYLSNCSIRGTLPKWLSSFMNLTRLDLSNNQIEGPIPELASSMTYLDLSDNMLINGSIPDSLCQMKSLRFLDLSKNHLSGNLPDSQQQQLYRATSHTNCSRLMLLDVGENKLSGKLPELDIGQYPDGLRFLRLRNNEFYDIIPSSYCQLYRLQILDLAQNNLTGNIPHYVGNFLGMVKDGRFGLEWEGVSFSEVMKGVMMEYTKTSTYTVNLDLSSNNLVGEICGDPIFLSRMNGHEELFILYTDRLVTQSGAATTIAPLGGFRRGISRSAARRLDRWWSNVDRFPMCNGVRLTGCFQDVRVGSGCFDFGQQASGDGETSQVLPKVDLWGCPVQERGRPVRLGAVRCDFGTVERCFEAFGGRLELSAHTLGFGSGLVSVRNSGRDKIPPNLTNLTGLHGLNLSNNHLRGRIPRKIGDMESLESLDLSSNNLSGTIPESLSKLNFLSHLNLSRNNLSGRIPTGHQLQTLNESSNYEGNSGLCGAPLLKKCHNDNETPPKVEHDDDDDNEEISYKIYLIASIMSGLATGFWGTVGVLVFKRSWRLALFKRMDMLIGKILG
ncbi:hypothetical protein CASFOL_020264 [Castilleja foliolosa]|uniref:Leucine-rich repeat-containing N-terminal plant-type domain-containing protein n=1 Tax=Castilleja foliolosa TaxID=1961234 RepID=A0ABD3D4J9_9LAMI